MGRRTVIERCILCKKTHWVWVPNPAMPDGTDEYGYVCPETEGRVWVRMIGVAAEVNVLPEEGDLIGYEELPGDEK